MEWTKNDYLIATDKSLINTAIVHQFLTNSYWAGGIPEETVERCIKGSLCFTVLHKGEQIGFARVITDEATFAYLADVFILEAHRGKGLSKWLMDVIINYPTLQGLRRFMLATRDAHSLYAQYGFSSITNVDKWMQIHNPDVYKK
ncbi:MAG: GNAT family N-acetyltransferase [Chitinophagaceae bacterium]